MYQDYLCISIPTELQQYSKAASINNEDLSKTDKQCPDFGVKLIKDEQGNLLYTAYYSDLGELIKKIYYNGSTVESIEHYRNNIIYSQEKYNDGKITRKTKYNSDGKQVCKVLYEYNRNYQIIAIRKNAGSNKYEIEYGYDELVRVNSRIIKINNKIVAEQKYKYDILDRVVEFIDKNQKIKVIKINPKNKLLHYEITDKLGNIITIINKYICSEYIGTEIDLNGHKTTINDKSYIDNVMLKKPFTSEDDLDLVVSKMLKKAVYEADNSVIPITQRNNNDKDISNLIIEDKIQNRQKLLPISRRKILLLESA